MKHLLYMILVVAVSGTAMAQKPKAKKAVKAKAAAVAPVKNTTVKTTTAVAPNTTVQTVTTITANEKGVAKVNTQATSKPATTAVANPVAVPANKTTPQKVVPFDSEISTRTSQIITERRDRSASRGFRIAILRPFLDAKFSIDDGEKYTAKMTNNVGGISLGYAYIPQFGLGFTTNLGMRRYFDETDMAYMVDQAILDGNLVIGAGQYLNFKLGGNVSKFTNSILAEMGVGVGAQGGIGLQFTRNFGLDVQGIITQQRKDDIEVQQYGIEVILNATF